MTTTSRSLPVRSLLFLAALVFAAPAAAQEVSGSWSSRISAERHDGDRVQLSLEVDSDGDHWQHGFSRSIRDLAGVTLEQLQADEGEVTFRLEREAGTLVFDGRIRDGRGSGTFRFDPDAGYRAAMASLGYAELSARDQYSFAIFDITTDFVRELGELGYERLPKQDLRRFAIHGVRADYIRGMNALGYADIPAEDLVRMRIHGVSPEWVSAIRSALDG